jgi:SPP1 gp7 family putative phage head morphogenesis protein
VNRWEKEVLESLLGSEEEALKELERQYARALADINQKVKLFQADIDLLDQALSQDGLDDATKALLQSRKRSKVYQQQYQQALQGQVGSILDKMHGDNYATIDKYLHGCYETGYIGTMYDIAKQGIPVIVPIDQAAVIKAILTDSKVSGGLYNRLGVDVGKLKKTITQEISRGIATGMGYGDIARNIRNVSGAPMSRTKTIARTEGHRIQQTSAVNAQQKAKAKGADVLKQWDAALDGRTRDSHRQVDGEIKELDEKFSNGLMFPGDPNGGAAEVVNCRCTSNTRARWALGEEELQTLKERAEYFGLDKTENFKEFEEKYLKAAKTLENDGKSGIIKLSDILFGKSIGAKAKNYEVMDLDTGEMFRFAEGTRLQDVEVFAGKGTKSILNIAGKYAKAYGGKPEDWQHVKGHGVLDTPDGYRNAEVHWMQCEGFGKHDFFVKKWED